MTILFKFSQKIVVETTVFGGFARKPSIPDKNTKEFMADLKQVYQAPNLKTAEDNLLNFEEKWSKIYPQAVALGSIIGAISPPILTILNRFVR